MNERGEPVICDYRMSVIAYHTQSFIESGTYENLKKTTRWLAPELLEPNAMHTKASDIWAFGMTVYVSFLWIPRTRFFLIITLAGDNHGWRALCPTQE